MIASGGLFKKKIWEGALARGDGQMGELGRLPARAGRLRQGDATISLSAKAEWDLAAAAVIMDEAGGITTDHHGNPHPYNRETPRFPSLVASGKALHPLLIERTSRIDL